MKNKKQYSKYILPTIFWGGFLIIGSRLVGNDILLPNPLLILKTMGESILDFYFWKIFFKSFITIVLSSLLGLVLGSGLAYLSYLNRPLEYIIKPMMVFFKTTPLAALVVIILVWFDSGAVSSLIVLMIVLPQVYFFVLYDLRHLDRDILDMIKVFGPTKTILFRKIHLKEILISIYRSFTVTFGLAWKAGISGEIIGQAVNTMGNQLYEDKLYLETTNLFAHLFLLILLVYLFERLINKIFSSIIDI